MLGVGDRGHTGGKIGLLSFIAINAMSSNKTPVVFKISVEFHFGIPKKKEK